MSTHPLFEKLQNGIEHQQKGNLEEAEKIYHEILEESPDHPDALHLLGVIALQIGEYEVAEDLIQRAIDSDYQVADYHNNLGEVYRATDRKDLAVEQYHLALELDPAHANARSNLEKLQPGQTTATTPSNQTDLLPKVRHALPSYLFSLDDEDYPANRKLIEISLAAGLNASELDLSSMAARFPDETGFMINVWPGEHYRFLTALVNVIQPQQVIEIGTATGASALAMKLALPEGGNIISYDVIPWQQYPGSGLTELDMDEKLEQRIIDLSDSSQAQSEIPVLQQADLIFVDAAKDYVMEQKFCALFDSIQFSKNPIIVFDDIRTMNMLKIWREIRHPKLDITSYGHWSGTGMVDWTA